MAKLRQALSANVQRLQNIRLRHHAFHFPFGGNHEQYGLPMFAQQEAKGLHNIAVRGDRTSSFLDKLAVPNGFRIISADSTHPELEASRGPLQRDLAIGLRKIYGDAEIGRAHV